MDIHHYLHYADPEFHQKLDLILKELRAFRTEDRTGDERMSAESQKAINELKAEITPLRDGVTAVSTAMDRLLSLVEDHADDPEELREIVTNVRAERERIVAAALKGTPIAPSGE